MNTGDGNKIQTFANTGIFYTNDGVYFGSGACHGRKSLFRSYPK